MDERLVRTRLERNRSSSSDSDDDGEKRRREYQAKKAKQQAELRFTDGDPYDEYESERERDNARRAGGEAWEKYLADIQTKRENYIKKFRLEPEDMNFLQKVGASFMRCFLGDGKFSLDTVNDRVLVWATYDGIVHFPASVGAIKQKLRSIGTQTDMDITGGNKTKRRHRRKSTRHRRKSTRHRKKSTRHRRKSVRYRKNH
jgi:hypothetical protein